jgi:hypothetical protein
MKHKSKLAFLCLSFFALLLFSCKKELKISSVTIPENHSTDGVPIPPLDWENIDFMPMPPGTFIVHTPWGSGSSNTIPAEMLDDYSSADGWRLVYNTFNTTTLPGSYYFMLYNVYRGILRLYFYVPPTANYEPSDNLVHTLSVQKSYAPSSPMMNFAGQRVVNLITNASFASSIEEARMGPDTWYAMEYELAYDKNMSSQNFNSLILDWNCEAHNITNIKLGGTISGTIVGSISLPGTNFTLSPTVNIDNKRGNITIAGSGGADKLKPTLGDAIVGGIKSAITSGLKGLFNNAINAIFKKDEDTPPDENVHLKLEASISLQGTATDEFLITSPIFAVPGYNQTNTVGYIPGYNQPLGVFYLSNRPTIRYHRTDVNTGDRTTSYTLYGYQVDMSSFQIDVNPAVLAIATIQNIEAEVVWLDPTSFIDIGGDLEMSGTTTMYTDINALTVGYLRPTPVMTVRLSFDVVPNNGADPVRIGHIFNSTMVQQ